MKSSKYGRLKKIVVEYFSTNKPFSQEENELIINAIFYLKGYNSYSESLYNSLKCESAQLANMYFLGNSESKREK